MSKFGLCYCETSSAGQQLSASQVAGISTLVASAMKNLKASQVVLVDETGALLSGDGNEDDSLMGATTLLQARQQHESDSKKSILDHLTPTMWALRLTCLSL